MISFKKILGGSTDLSIEADFDEEDMNYMNYFDLICNVKKALKIFLKDIIWVFTFVTGYKPCYRKMKSPECEPNALQLIEAELNGGSVSILAWRLQFEFLYKSAPYRPIRPVYFSGGSSTRINEGGKGGEVTGPKRDTFATAGSQVAKAAGGSASDGTIDGVYRSYWKNDIYFHKTGAIAILNIFSRGVLWQLYCYTTGDDPPIKKKKKLVPTPTPVTTLTPAPTPSPCDGPAPPATCTPEPTPSPSPDCGEPPLPECTPEPTPAPPFEPKVKVTPSPTPGPCDSDDPDPMCTPVPTPTPPTPSPTPVPPTPSPTPGPCDSDDPDPMCTPSPTPVPPTPSPTPSPTPTPPTPSPTPGPCDSDDPDPSCTPS